MRVLTWDEVLSGARGASGKPAAATIGVFDGLHIGHMALVSRVVGLSPGFEPIAVTFRGNPKRLTAPHRQTDALFSLEQKLEVFEGSGMAATVLIDFSGNFSKLAGGDFVSILVNSCGVRFFAIGSDFKCGHRLSTDSAALREIALSLGAETDIVDPVMYGGEPVSSSRIRAAICDGRMDLARAMLGRPYALDLRSLDPKPTGGIMRVSMRARDVVLPKAGSYEARIDGTPVVASVHRDASIEWTDCAAGNPRFLQFC